MRWAVAARGAPGIDQRPRSPNSATVPALLAFGPQTDGRQAGLTYTDRNGVAHATYPLAPDYQGCGHPDPDHSYEGGRVEYDGGRCDGWLRAGANDTYAIGYYTRDDLAFLGRAATDWTTFSRYFAAILAETYPN